MAEKKAPAKKAEPVKSSASAKKPAPAKSATAEKKTQPAKSSETMAKKSQPTKVATTKKAEPVKNTAAEKKSESTKTASTVKKSEPAKASSTVKKNEPEKTAAAVKKSEPIKATPSANKSESEKKASFADRKSAVKKDTAEISAALAAESAKNNAQKAKAENKPTMVADSKPKAKTAKVKSTGSSGGAATATMNNKKKTIIIASVAAVLVLVLVLSLVLGLHSCSGAGNDPSNPNLTLDPDKLGAESMYRNTTQVGTSSEILGKTERVKPVAGMKDGNLPTGYPKYGQTLPLDVEQKGAIIKENSLLMSGVTYNWMDENGYLYKGTRTEYTNTTDDNGNHRQLYKHTASVGLYGGDVSDNEEAVIKQLTFRKRSYSSYYEVTGLYAPAGEVIKVELTEEDMDATGGIVIHMGQALYNGQANNIWAKKNFNRMPVILNTMTIDKNTAVLKDGVWTGYIGTFLGGPIYIRDENPEYTVTISGGVNYPHFILGSTTEEQFLEYSKSSAPIFDLEIWDNGVLHSGPKQYAKAYSYEDIRKAAILWEKIAIVSTKVVNQGIVFLYDPFVAAGAAVAFPGRRSVNCPAGWMSASLNYNAIVTSGSWGNLHEYHHNFQNYGVGDRGEVTNNALTLVSYSLFTKISSSRQLTTNYGAGGLSGWNQYTSATWALNRVNAGGDAIKSTNGLAVYSTLLHNFGQDAFIKSTGASNAAYFNKWAANTHQDFTYFASQITGFTGSMIQPAATDYPTFVPISSVYQTGRSYMYDNEKRYIQTMQPFVIPYGKAYTFDLNKYTTENGQYRSGSVMVGNGFNAKLIDLKYDKINGSIKKESDGIYTFTPNSELLSGKIYATFEITTTSGAKTYNGKPLQNVELVIEFQQSHETNKAILERTTYSYDESNMPESATAAFESGFANAKSNEKIDHTNPTQNANTDIWQYPDTPENRENYSNAPESWFLHDNQVAVIDGKIFFPDDGTYRIYLRGRNNCAVYWSLDNKDYKLGATVTTAPYTAQFQPDKEETYFDVEFDENIVKIDGVVITDKYTSEDRWLYTKEVLVMSQSARSYIGLGMVQWEVPLYSMKYFKNGVEVDAETEDAEVRYYDKFGIQVSEEQASNPNPTEPAANARVSYLNAYRQSYEFQKEFESEYFYYKEYRYNYTYNVPFAGKQTVLESLNYKPYNANRDKAENIVDDNTGTYIHTNGEAVTADAPVIFTVDAGEVVSANRIILQTQNRPNGDWYYPVDFKLYGSLDGEKFDLIGEYTDQKRAGTVITTDLGKLATFRYYKLAITKSSGKYLIITEVDFAEHYENLGAKQYSIDDSMIKYSGKWSTKTIYSTYGHIAVGQNGATMEFEIDGNQLGILSTAGLGNNVEVVIDGKVVAPTTYKIKGTEKIKLAYMSPVLSSGKHKVKITCKGADTAIDSIAVWNNVE